MERLFNQLKIQWRKALLLVVVGLVANCGVDPNKMYTPRPLTPTQLSKVSTPPIQANTEAVKNLVLYEGCEAFDIHSHIENLFTLAPRVRLELKNIQNQLPSLGSPEIQIQQASTGRYHINHCPPGVASFEAAALIPGTTSTLVVQNLKLVVLPREQNEANLSEAQPSEAQPSEANLVQNPHLVPEAEGLVLSDYFALPQKVQKLKIKKTVTNNIKVQLKWPVTQTEASLYQLTRCRRVSKLKCTHKKTNMLFARSNRYHNLADLLQLHIQPWPKGSKVISLRARGETSKPTSFTKKKDFYYYTEPVLEGHTYLYTLTVVNAVGKSLSLQKKIKAPRISFQRPRNLNLENVWQGHKPVTRISFEKPRALPAVEDYVLSTCVGDKRDCEDPSHWHPLEVPLDLSKTPLPSAKSPSKPKPGLLQWLLPLTDLWPSEYGSAGGVNGAERHVRVQARDAQGRWLGVPSKSVQLKAGKSLGAVNELQAVLTHTQPLQQNDLGVQLHWVPPTYFEHNKNISYVLQRALCTDCSQASWQNVYLPSAQVLQHEDRFELQAGQSYTYRVQAKLDEERSTWQQVRISVPVLPPQAPATLTVVKLSSNAIKVSWPLSPYDGGAEVESYKLERSHTPDNWMTLKHNISADLRAYTDLGLLNPFVPGQKYTYRLSARNSRGQSGFVYSKALLWLTLPDEPTALTALPIKKEALWASELGFSLKWQAPVNNGGSELTAYKLERCKGAVSLCAYGPWKEFKIKVQTDYLDQSDLLPATTYTYKLSAVNSQGEGEASQPLSVTTPAVLASAPEQLQAALHKGAHHLFWQAPVSNGGAKVLDYRVQVCLANQNEDNVMCLPSKIAGWRELEDLRILQTQGRPSRHTAQLEVGPLLKQWFTTASLLARGARLAEEQFYYRVAARNKRGLGPWSSKQTLQALRPAGPPQSFKLFRMDAKLRAAATSSRRLTKPQINLQWKAPHNLGWPFVQHYELQACIDKQTSSCAPWQSIEAELQAELWQHEQVFDATAPCYRVRAKALWTGAASPVLCQPPL